MKILLDMNLSPSWVPYLQEAGYEVRHWSEVGSVNAPDKDIMDWARQNGFIVFTHDLDYGSLLFATGAVSPSVIQLRGEDIRPTSTNNLVINALREAEKPLERGALISLDLRKNRIRLLPLRTQAK